MLQASLKSPTQFYKVVTVTLATLMLLGCAATTRDINVEEPLHYDAAYGFSDKKRIVDDLTNSLLNSPTVPADSDRPVLIVYGVANQTSEHIDTSGITDDIRLALLQSGRYRFISKAQRDNIIKETAFQSSGAVDPAQVIRVGKQTGANYILGGTLRSIEKEQPRQWRLNKRKLIFYSLNLELTNLTSGEISWADKVEIARESTQPIVRW